MSGCRPYPRGMVARLAVVLVSALVIELLGVLLIHRWDDRVLISDERIREIAGQLVAVRETAGNAPSAARERAIEGLSRPDLVIGWAAESMMVDASGTHARLKGMRERLKGNAPSLSDADLRLSLVASDDASRRDLVGAMRLADGSFVKFRVPHFIGPPLPFAVAALLDVALLALVIGIALLMVRALVRPLSNLAEAADGTSRGTAMDVSPEGPWEVRRVATAFAAMQTRLLQLVDDHTQALVAVSHDLRTPIQRLRLRTALLADPELREAMAADLVDMEKFINSVVGLMQDGSDEEDSLVDLPAMIMTMVDNAADTGASVAYDGPAQLAARIKPMALKRALGNLLDNARRHAARIRVTLSSGEDIAVAVEDDGPGIPPDWREEALLPFRTLGSGHRGPGQGSGLGLAIVRKAAAGMGGSIELRESEMGGLAAIIRLPRHRADISRQSGRFGEEDLRIARNKASRKPT